MATKQVIILVILVIIQSTTEDFSNNKIDDRDPLDEAKADILKEQDMQNIGGMLNNFIQSEGAKQLGNILMNAAASGDGGGQILQGLGAAMNMLQPSEDKENEDAVDSSLIFSLLGNMLGGQMKNKNIMSYLPMLYQTIQSFVGPEAQERAHAHADHAKLMPPFIEKIHLWFDHFLNTDIAKHFINKIGGEKYIKVFSDDKGRFSYRKMVDMLENHSFRRHWISMITSRIAKAISFLSNTKLQKKGLITFQNFVNSILKSQGYSKSIFIDFNRPVESIAAFINQLAKDYLSIKIDAKLYVKPVVKYIQELFSLAHQRGILDVDQQQLSDKLADTINMDIIEPFARVNRAYRFALKVPECDKYVMCLVNQKPQNEIPRLPGLRPLLSKSTSVILSWFLSSRSGTSFLTLYSIITDEADCQRYYTSKCHDFHLEEVKVTTEYVHNEL